MTVRRISDLDLGSRAGREFFPSPDAWEDQVLYFLMLDRFSNGGERDYRGNDGSVVVDGSIAPFEPADAGNAVASESAAAQWRDAGGRWVGGPRAA